MMTIFLVFSINSYSQDKTHKTVQSAKTEQPQKGNAKPGRKPKKLKSKKKVHLSVPKKHSQKKAGNKIGL